MLKDDRCKCTANVAGEIEQKLNAGKPKEAWWLLKGWYRMAEDQAPKPCPTSMTVQTQEMVELYRKVPPPGDPICINVEAFPINNAIPEGGEIRGVVQGPGDIGSVCSQIIFLLGQGTEGTSAMLRCDILNTTTPTIGPCSQPCTPVPNGNYRGTGNDGTIFCFDSPDKGHIQRWKRPSRS